MKHYARTVAMVLAISPAFAEDTAHKAHKMEMSSAAPWAGEYDAANMTMHEGMSMGYTDNADLDFARAMLAHHEGAVAMAQIQLKYGVDPEMRALAEAIIKAQAAEIDQMRAFIAKMGG